MFLVGKLLNVKPRIRTMLPPVQQTLNSLLFRKKLLHRWCNSLDFVQPICRLVGLWHLRIECHHTIRYSCQFLFLRQHQGYSARHCHCIYDGHYRPVHPRSHYVEKGDDLAIDRHFLRCGNTVDNHFRLFVQLDIIGT